VYTRGNTNQGRYHQVEVLSTSVKTIGNFLSFFSAEIFLLKKGKVILR
jgi:hypothetical protein